MNAKTEALDKVFHALKTKVGYGSEYLLLKNVEATIVISSNFIRNRSDKLSTFDLVAVGLDHSPIVVFDIVESWKTTNDRKQELEKEIKLLSDAEIPIFHVGVDEAVNIPNIEYRINIALSEKKKRDQNTEKDNSAEIESLVEIANNNTKRSNKYLNYIAIALLFAAGYIFYTKFKAVTAETSEKKISVSMVPAVDNSIVDAKANTEKVRVEERTNLNVVSKASKCDSGPPENGSVSVLSSDVQGDGNGYWKFDNTTDRHVLVNILNNGKDILNIYISPNNSASFTVVAANYKYIANSSLEWCNIKSINANGVFDSSSSSTGETRNMLKRIALITTSFLHGRGFFGSATKVEQVE